VGESSIPQEDVDDWSTPVFEVRRDFDVQFLELFEAPVLTDSTRVEKLSLSCICVLPL
jgi:hypothetical protein